MDDAATEPMIAPGARFGENQEPGSRTRIKNLRDYRRRSRRGDIALAVTRRVVEREWQG